MHIFGTKKEVVTERLSSNRKDFEFVPEGTVYLDSACQTLRPQPVQDAMMKYFQEFNACSGRVKYDWGRRVDEAVEKTRKKVLDYVGKSSQEYGVAFTLNTTYGLNLLLSQLPVGIYQRIVTSDIEHNSVFLPTLAAAKRLALPRKILSRKEDGSLTYRTEDLSGAIVVVNVASNIDGRALGNVRLLADDLRRAGGILILDGAQSMTDRAAVWREADFDALCFSGHKMYAPSLGGIIVKRKLLESLELSFIGGGMVEKLDEKGFTLPANDPVCRLEPGLQDFAGIVGLGATLDWLESYRPEGQKHEEHKKRLAQMVFEGLSSLPGIFLLNSEPSATISFYSQDIDAHRLATVLSQQNVMVRSGYFCCHYYLQNIKKLPPLLRVSLGIHNTEEDIRKFLKIMGKVIKNIN